MFMSYEVQLSAERGNCHAAAVASSCASTSAAMMPGLEVCRRDRVGATLLASDPGPFLADAGRIALVLAFILTAGAFARLDGVR
jgi:hypothetical protein